MKRYLAMLMGSKQYIRYLRKIGCKIGNDTIIYRPLLSVTIDETRPWLIDIGNHVRITKGVTILTHDYSWSVIKTRDGRIMGAAKKIKICDNVFIGVNSTILGGVTIGNNVIIGANSLITKDVPDNVVVAGNPAKIICTVDQYKNKRLKQQLNEAVELTHSYYDTYNRWPQKKILREFVWIFEDRKINIDNDDVFSEIGSLCDNYAMTKKAFLESHGEFKNYDDFIDYCKKKYFEKQNERATK